MFKKPREKVMGSNLRNKTMKRVIHILESSCILFLFLQVTIVIIVVFGRFVLNKTPQWGEEVALLNMVWLSMVSAVLAEMDDDHIRMNIIDRLLSKKLIRIRELVFNVINAAFSLFLIVEGFKLAFLTRKSIMPGSRLPVPILYLSVPFASIFLLIVILNKFGEKGVS
jgi:TRAP-type C4-dicarboxylate transport system permease small subunit